MTKLHQLSRQGLALSDTTRLRLLHALAGGELCACQLVALAGLANSTVSKHCSLLEQAGLVERRKEGRWVYYRLAKTTALARAVLKTLEASADLDIDRKRLKKIRAMPVETTCQQQRKN